MLAPTFTMTAIGVVRSGFVDKVSTPRQPFVADAVTQQDVGRIELFSGHNFEDALLDLESFTHLWLLFVFDQNSTWHPKVMPPVGSERKRGVFATRSPHRPNPIGMSVLKIISVHALTIEVSGLDILDGTPVLDIKPYVPMADIVGDANRGWLEVNHHEPIAYRVTFADRARQQLAWWLSRTSEDLQPRIEQALAVAPKPHAYRRIRKARDGSLSLAIASWRVDFTVNGSVVEVVSLRTAHKQSHFDHDPSLHHHREFLAAFDL
jgi:tRNA (adenine37-N6)-methyltransferase